MGLGDGLLLARWVSVVGMSRGGDLEPQKKNGCGRWSVDQCGLWMFEMDEMRTNMKSMLWSGAIGFRILGHIIWMSSGQVAGGLLHYAGV